MLPLLIAGDRADLCADRGGIDLSVTATVALASVRRSWS